MSKMKFRLWFSIRQKIVLIILTVTILSILAGFTIEFFTNINTSRNELKNNTTLDAKLIADYLIPTFLFDDRAGAEEILNKLGNIPTIIHGLAYNTDGKLYAEYISSASGDTSKFLPVDLQSINNPNQIIVTEPVISEGENIGKVILVASTDIIHEKIRAHIKLVLIILLISILLAILLAFGLERIISGPILRLGSVARHIQATLDYSIRVEKKTHDETGLLYDAFNDMLKSIELSKKERDLAQNKLKEEHANLEKRVLERTGELNDAKEKAEESDKLKSAFLANMSHEIRTPLNAILGCSSLISQTSPTPEELKEYCKMMDTSGVDLLHLIDDLLDISLIEANQIKIELHETSVSQLAEEVFKTFKQMLYSEKPDLSVAPVFIVPPDKEDYFLNTDPFRLKQILLNILNNAVKFTIEGSIEFCYSPDKTRNNIVFYIKDTGIGIAKDQQTKIFERFMKLADLKTKHYRGTGLGLSIALKLTHLLNGEIKVESELNVGTAFYLSFPLSRIHIPEGPHKPKFIDESLAFLSGKVILIAEDVDYNYKYLEILLGRNNDVKIIWAKNGVEAVDCCKKNPEIDIVLMDIQLPEMDGIEATKLIKAMNRKLPVVAQTAYGTSSTITDCRVAGCDDVLVKPIDKSTLIQLLRKYLT
jgi:signal transduction histidine kinase/CheY-like chemotaxis protein